MYLEDVKKDICNYIKRLDMLSKLVSLKCIPLFEKKNAPSLFSAFRHLPLDLIYAALCGAPSATSHCVDFMRMC